MKPFLFVPSLSALMRRCALPIVTCSLAVSASRGDTLIDYTFDGVANDVGPAVQVVENNTDVPTTVSGTPTVPTAGNADTGTGLVTAGSNNHPTSSGSRNNHSIGLNSSATVGLAGFNSFTATFVIDSITLNLTEGTTVADLLSNGMFFGVVSTTGTSTLWNSTAASHEAFGYRPGAGGTDTTGDHMMVRNQGLGGSQTYTTDAITSALPSNASLIDGFTVSLTVNNDDTWSVSSTGLSTELSDSGSMAGLWVDFSGGAGLYAGFQGNAGGQLDMGRMTLTASSTTEVATVTVTSGPHGSVSPTGSVQVPIGSSPTFTFAPETNFHTAEVLVGGLPVDFSSSVTLNNVSADTTLHATFAANRVINRVPAWWLDESFPGWSGSLIELAAADPDGDGRLTWDEYHAGSDAADPTDFFQLEIGPSAQGVEVAFDALSADPRDQNEGYQRIYSLMQQDNLQAAWDGVPGKTNVVGAGQRVTHEADPAVDPKEFYRATATVTDGTNPDTRLPNIILILTDDQGTGDFSFRGHPYLQTPNLDRLAREGTVYQQYYANGSVCSPTRASLMTSRYPARDRVHGHFASHANNASRGMPNDLDPGGVTITDALKSHGYTTAHIGKWHLGDTKALAEYGIDFESSMDSITNSLESSDYWNQFDQSHVDQYFRNLMTHAMAHETCKFIEASQNRPFYINFWSMLPHATLTPTPEQLAVYAGLDADPSDFPASWMRDYFANASNFDSKMQIYAASVTALDEAIGILMNKLDELGLSENTLILMTSDNGPEDYTVGGSGNAGVGSSELFRARKRSLYEGGVRAPCIIRWPGHVPIGKVNSTSVMSTADWFPTIIGALGRIDPGITMPALTPATDGEDMSDVLLGSERLRTRPLHWEWRSTVFENSDPVADYTPPSLAIRDGQWKFFVQPNGTEPELYDVLAEPEERTNLAGLPEHSGRVADFTTQLQAWKATLPP